MSKPKIYRVSGSGFPIDGSFVVIVEEKVIGDTTYCVVEPLKSFAAVRSVLIAKKYLEQISNLQDTYTYVVSVSKISNATKQTEQDYIQFTCVKRNLQVKTLLQSIFKSLSVILK